MGFDCSHVSDYSPGSGLEHIYVGKQEYRNIEYVTEEIKRLVDQLTDEGILATSLRDSNE